jgi:membrane peptidoglycan carboxypeptidase
MVRGATIAGLIVGISILALAGYETARIFQARAQTPHLIAAINQRADPEIARLPPERIAMLLAVEDPTFWTNDGTDFFSLGAGKTTLTQSLGKGLYFPNGFHPGFPKIELILIAKFATTPLAAKRDILRAAMATYYFSHDEKGDVVGFAEAARRYFGRPLSALSDDQYLALVAMLRAPNATDPKRHPAANAERVSRIRRLLAHACVPLGAGDDELKGCA